MTGIGLAKFKIPNPGPYVDYERAELRGADGTVVESWDIVGNVMWTPYRSFRSHPGDVVVAFGNTEHGVPIEHRVLRWDQ